MKKIRTVLIDDEPLALRGLELRLEGFKDVEIVGQCRNGREAIITIREEKPELIFLDIQMPGLDGFAVIKALISTYMPIIVFVTAFDEFALKAFETHALDYLLKPVDEERLAQAVQRVRDQLRQRVAVEQNARVLELMEGMEDPPKVILEAVLEEAPGAPGSAFERQISIKDRGFITRVEVGEIDYIDAAGDYMCIHTGQKTHILRATMKHMQKRLDPDQFQRVHRSTIVNLERVREVHPHSNGEYFLVLGNGAELKVSRSYKEVIARFL